MPTFQATCRPMAQTDLERGPRAAWLRRHRRARYGSGDGGLSQLAAALRDRGFDRSPTTIRGWESNDGRSPIPADILVALEELFDERAPRPLEHATPGDLVAALMAQTEAMLALVEELRLDRAERAADREADRELANAAGRQGGLASGLRGAAPRTA